MAALLLSGSARQRNRDACLACAEGFTAHARSIELRFGEDHRWFPDFPRTSDGLR
jgi:hypothetical protein